MIERVIEYSVRQRLVIFVGAAILAAWGVYALSHTPVDAIPDLSENQVIVFTDWMGRSPQEIEDQITYPLSVNLQGLAGVQVVRATSEFNFSMINIIFDDSVDYYFARERVLERLSLASTFLPEGVTPYLAPDATALGQIYWYTIEGEGYDLGRLRAIQDWYVRYQLNSVPGVAEVASVGGYPIEYQIDVDPDLLRAFDVTLGEVYRAVEESNSAVGGRVIHLSGAEYIVRSAGWLGNRPQGDGLSATPADAAEDVLQDIRNIVVAQREGVPVYVRQVADVQLGTQYRRSVIERDGHESVGGVVIMRYGENPLEVTERVEDKIQELQAGLPEGVRIVPFYDRRPLIHAATHTVRAALLEAMLTASILILLVLGHLGGALVVVFTLPLAILFSFILMQQIGVSSNIMSLSGLVISIGVLVDSSIVMTENAAHRLTKKFGDARIKGDTKEEIIAACRTVGRPIFFSIMIMLLAFLPVFALGGIEGRMFHPLAWTKTLAMVGVSILAITLVPALLPTFLRGRIKSEDQNWLVRNFIAIYRPMLAWFMRHPNLVIGVLAAFVLVAMGFAVKTDGLILGLPAFGVLTGLVLLAAVIFMHGFVWKVAGVVALTALALVTAGFPKLGGERWPPLNEGTILDMATSVPRMSITQVTDDIIARDAMLRSFPEVTSVVGKAGRAETPTDPAPLEMLETVVNLLPLEMRPRRHLAYDNALAQAQVVQAALVERGILQLPERQADRETLLNDVTMAAVTRLDNTLRELADRRLDEYKAALGRALVETAVDELLDVLRDQGSLLREPTDEERDQLVAALNDPYGRYFGDDVLRADVTRLAHRTAEHLARIDVVANVLAGRRRAAGGVAAAWVPDPNAVELRSDVLTLEPNLAENVTWAVGELLGEPRPTLFRHLHALLAQRRRELLAERIARLDEALFNQAVGRPDPDASYNWFVIDEFLRAALAVQYEEMQAAEQQRPQDGRDAPQRHDHDEGDRGEPLRLLREARTDELQELRAELDHDFATGMVIGPFASGLVLRAKTIEELESEMGTVISMPGWSPVWTQPIINRVDMLSTGVNTMIGVRIFGRDLEQIQAVALRVAEVLRGVDGATDVTPDQITGKGYVETRIDRQRAAQYGVSVGDIQSVVEVALGGRAITMTVEGRERFPVRIRYPREERGDVESIRRILVNAGGGMAGNMASGMSATDASPAPASGNAAGPIQVPLSQVADVRLVEGPGVIKSENGLLRAYVRLNVRGRDLSSFVTEARRAVAQQVTLPEGMYLEWGGQFEHQLRARRTLSIIMPMVVVLILLILYVTFKDLAEALLVMPAVLGALAGGAIFQAIFGFNFSVAVWIGYIAAFGFATETGVVMLVYLREAIAERGGLEKIASLEQLREAVMSGAVHRLRPKILVEATTIIGVAPMLWATGVGAEVIRPMAAPVLGGLLVADEVIDVFLPVFYYWLERRRWRRLHKTPAKVEAAPLAAPA